MPIESPWLTVTEAADYAHRHSNTITNALRAGSLRGSQTKRFGKWLIHREALDAWLSGEVADIRVPVSTRAS